MKREYSPDLIHEKIVSTRTPLLMFDENADYITWKNSVKEKLVELLGDMPEKVPLNVDIEWRQEFDTYVEIRFSFDAEAETKVPCHLFIPKEVKKPCPVVICLQGHTTGMHISFGYPIFDPDEGYIARDGDFACQALKEGYAALVIEQRGFGERFTSKDHAPEGEPTCWYPSMSALLVGRTMIGERVWDISCAIDALNVFDEIDMSRVGCMGNSGGGTAAYYAACMDERIKIVMPSCAVCTFKDSIGLMRHCVCNYIPGIAKYFDMGDLACLIAPRPLVMVSGKYDVGFFFRGAVESYNTIQRIYNKAKVPDKCKLVVGDAGHKFYPVLGCKAFRELSGWD